MYHKMCEPTYVRTCVDHMCRVVQISSSFATYMGCVNNVTTLVCAHRFPPFLFFVDIMDSLGQQLLVDTTEVGHLLLAPLVTGSTTACGERSNKVLRT